MSDTTNPLGSIGALLERGWKIVYVDAEPSLFGSLYTVTCENSAGVRTARHVRAETAAHLRAEPLTRKIVTQFGITEVAAMRER